MHFPYQLKLYSRVFSLISFNILKSYIYEHIPYFSVSVNLRSSMPHTSGVNAIGILMIACIIMVFAALIEYGLILFFMINKPRPEKVINFNNCNCVREYDDSNHGTTITTINGRTKNGVFVSYLSHLAHCFHRHFSPFLL